MLVKFLARGTGSAGAAARYLLGERDAAGKLREGVEVLRGNPDMVAAVADTLAFEHRYTSGVIAWAPEDRPTDEQIEAVLDAFEKTAWAGLEPDRYAWAAVLHREHGGGAHVHVLAARCDLETGRSLKHRASGLGEDLRPPPGRLQPRTRLGSTGRPGAGQGAAAWAPRLCRGDAVEGRPPARSLTPRPDPGLPATEGRPRHGAEPCRGRLRTAGSGP